MADEFDYKDYTQVHPESNTGYKYGFGRDKTPYVKGRPYERGQDFYPDRLFRDEQSAVRQFWDSPNQDPEFMEYIESFPSGKKGNWKREQEKDAWIKTLRDVDLRNRGTEGRYHPGPITIADERFGVDYRRPGESWGLVGLLKDTRAEQMKKYSPYYGMTEKQLKDHFKKMQRLNMEDIRKERYLEHGYGWEGPEDEDDTIGSKFKDIFWTDYERAAGSGLLEGAGLFADLASNVVKNLPYEDEVWTDKTIPKGLIDTASYQFKKMGFEDEVKEALGIDLEEAWLNLPQEQKDALNEDFKERSGYDYDPELNPWGFEDAPTRDFTDWAFHEPAEYIRSGMSMEDYDPITFNLPEKLGGEWTPFEGIGGTTWPEVTQKIAEFGPGWLYPAKLLGKGQSIAASPITKQLKKIPYAGKYLSALLSPTAQTSGIVSLGAWLDAQEGEE